MEDAPLIARVVADDDRHAFATLVRRHQSAVRGFLLRLCCGDGALADDVAQETFLRAYQRIGTYRSEGGFDSWLFSIAYRAFASEKRRRHWSAEELKEAPEAVEPDVRQANEAGHRHCARDASASRARTRVPSPCVTSGGCRIRRWRMFSTTRWERSKPISLGESKSSENIWHPTVNSGSKKDE